MATEQSMAPAGRNVSKSTIRLAKAGGRRRPNLRIMIGGGILTGFVVIAVVAPLIAPYDPLLPDQTRSLAPPSVAHPLGNDEFGRDVLSRLIFGARISIEVSMVSIVLALGIGTMAGLLAGYVGGLVDWIVMRAADVVLSVGPMGPSARTIRERVPLPVLCPPSALATAILSFNILGDGVRDLLDPRMR